MPKLQPLSAQDQARLKRQREANGEYQVDNEYMLLAEVGMYFGWNAIKDIVNNEVKDMQPIYELIKAVRKMKGVK